MRQGGGCVRIQPYEVSCLAIFEISYIRLGVGNVELSINKLSHEYEDWGDRNRLREYLIKGLKQRDLELILNIREDHEVDLIPFHIDRLPSIWGMINEIIDEFHKCEYVACSNCGGYKDNGDYYCCDVAEADMKGVEVEDL